MNNAFTPSIGRYFLRSSKRPVGVRSVSAPAVSTWPSFPRRALGVAAASEQARAPLLPPGHADNGFYGRCPHWPDRGPGAPVSGGQKDRAAVGSQIAVYIVERLFDGGSMALLFCSAILLSRLERFLTEDIQQVRQGRAGSHFGGRVVPGGRAPVGKSGSFVLESALAPLSHKLAHAAGQKIRPFTPGLDTLRTPADFAITLSLSLLMWGLITFAYVEGVGVVEAGREVPCRWPSVWR